MTEFIVTMIAVMEKLSAFGLSLADTTRWRILQLVLDEPMCVCELADILGMPQSSVSSHVQVIRKAGMLDGEKCGKWIYYRVAQPYRRLLRSVGEVCGSLPENDKVLRGDAQRAMARLEERESSCCPLPLKLAKLKPLTTPRRAGLKTVHS